MKLNFDGLRGAVCALLMSCTPVMAQEETAAPPVCGEPYTVQEGDTLQSLATLTYGRAADWTFIYYANLDAVQGRSLLVPGAQIRIPCLSGSDSRSTARAAAPRTQRNAPIRFSRAQRDKLRLITADDYRPFTDRSLPEGGMLTELVDTALTGTQEDYSITWINDWASHLDPLLSQQFFDVGFPWTRPSCETEPDNFRCVNFLFSDPMFEMLIVLHVTDATAFPFETDDDIEGKRLCRPASFYTYDLDENGRNWLSDDRILLLQPQTVRDCFDLLEQGIVDAVAVNEFLGRQTVSEMGLGDAVFTLPRAVSTQSMHLVVAKTHPRATTTLYKINEALRGMRDTGEYQEIISKHLATFWQDNG